ncbi:probable glucan endo-1,3-beta-glucosidase A6 [Vigna unguiculata]|uniref:glucan endo-1,3-beta-D-glucosidase n=1 Tax=Vigna unguiculata TaxID=3917 RepID=A0A4D6MME3_VIGUN|nr:probable glucan endo-1,3-beta-glucosidase A6 [Vigna unguiculata]QCE01299.1 Glycoside hydrolase superfamily [Vigna unguiculata]
MLRFFFSVALWFLCLLPHALPHPCIGVTYSAPSGSSNHHSQEVERISGGLRQLKARSLRLENADPSITRSLLYTNTTLFLTIPNYMVSQIAQNRSVAESWLYTHVVPFYPRVKITTISVGNAFPDVHPESLNDLIPAISNVHVSLRVLGIRKIKVSTSFSFVTALSSPFPPSNAQFQEPPGVTLFGPLLQFLQDTDSSFLINLYPYNLYRLNPEIPLGIALFQEYPFNFRDDFTTGVRYRNLFDVMVDAVVSALAVAGYETIPLVVTETGWPSFSNLGNEFDANLGYAGIYLKGLVKHLKSGMGTPLLKDGVREVFVYEMFDKDEGTGRSWGVLYANGTAKYRVDFSSSSLASSPVRVAVIIVFLIFVIT